MRPAHELAAVQSLIEEGLNDGAIACRTGIPRRTISDWRHRRNLRRVRSDDVTVCTADHDFNVLPAKAYSYLLGIYLGDGYISWGARGVTRLRLTLDSQYPGIIEECCVAMETVMRGQHAHQYVRPQSRCIDVSIYSKHWPCLIPQCGTGPKHLRRIELDDWQMTIVSQERKAFLRGLIHSDGTRIIARERQGGRTRLAPRYAFSNRSDDIKALFCDSCDALGIPWTRPNSMQIAIYQLKAVARLDEFIGPKR